jgi:hypothetical protein
MKYVSQCTRQLSPGCMTTSECLCVPAPPSKTIRVVEQTNKWASRPSRRAVDKVCVVTVVSPSQRSISPSPLRRPGRLGATRDGAVRGRGSQPKQGPRRGPPPSILRLPCASCRSGGTNRSPRGRPLWLRVASQRHGGRGKGDDNPANVCV